MGEGERDWGEVGAAHLSVPRNRLKVWRLWCRVMLVDCCSWVVNQDCIFIEICWRMALCKGGPECGQLEQEPDGQGAFMEAGWAISHGYYHVDCSGLIPERVGMPPLCQQQAKAVTITWRF